MGRNETNRLKGNLEKTRKFREKSEEREREGRKKLPKKYLNKGSKGES